MTGRIICSNVMDGLRSLPDQSVHCVVTSPPYWSLRDYGLPRTVWHGNDPAASTCSHKWGEVRQLPKITHWNSGGDFDPDARQTVQEAGACGEFCQLCGSWRGCLGLEPTIELFVAHTVQVFDEVWRVLRDDGVLWLNLGDCYTGSSNGGAQGQTGQMAGRGVTTARIKRDRQQFSQSRHLHADFEGPARNGGSVLPPKSVVGVPWRVAFAMQDAGWTLRSDIIWHKTNPMPESVSDRPTKSHEYIFLFSKGRRYFYDADAIAEPVAGPAHSRGKGAHPKAGQAGLSKTNRVRGASSFASSPRAMLPTRNKRSVWSLSSAPCKDAHFATFPPKLVEPCLLAGTSARGCCADCGAPYQRVVEKTTNWQERKELGVGAGNLGTSATYQNAVHGSKKSHYLGAAQATMKDWQPMCECDAGAPIPCTVLDPFSGAGTTAMVGLEHGRNAIGLDLNPEYVAISEKRIRRRLGLFAQITIETLQVLAEHEKMEAVV